MRTNRIKDGHRRPGFSCDQSSHPAEWQIGELLAQKLDALGAKMLNG
ncbi:MAG TPA: hypothetical protein VM100_06535 [Longimicrobiales bacterium]|nr:hypothetical protein [Longimicrobiales bacterium]